MWVLLAVAGAVLVALIIWLLVRDGDDDDAGPELQTITATLAADAEYSTLSELLAEAGLDEQLDGDGPFTVFAPTTKHSMPLVRGNRPSWRRHPNCWRRS